MTVLQKFKQSEHSAKVSAYINLCLASVSKMHYLHLVTRSYASHMALDEFYKEFPEKLDRIAETAMADGMAISYQDRTTSNEEIVVLDQLYKEGTFLSSQMVDNKAVDNAIIDALEFIKSVRYKLARFD